ncbi:MAG: tyrosine--tRNA ligase [Candidatus Andersenbacteria bacterium RIFCSPHIGHO2_12_FULL_45_11b]|uniref:tyrosine--tRNA ligase n=1 Tax=Candidatus Andersenbacteria bacterium RIFCSPHIGHO2_12_FULL_45_11b TaxID=1797282 RepID=A0A1G1XCF9_9BACT|nr:MAG: tyrosine--tRNA ligase [Candidatus Andersenbacteria bacterium RIFCSPHIGHO2_12_FULL_45_11b]
MTEKQEIINRLKANLAEIITPEEFEALIARVDAGEKITHYIGFEISGYVHIGQGIMSALVIKDLQALGVHCTIWLADWHTAINNKLDGTKETAAKIGKGYFTEAMKACLLAVGADGNAVEFRLASEWYAKDAMEYWDTVVKVAKNTTLARMQRSISIMGKESGEDVELATLLYPAMQVADIFYQDIVIAHASMDQRKAHVVMRDVANKISPSLRQGFGGQGKPIAIHHALIDSLTGDNKMSKSKPDSAVFVHDDAESINAKIKKAFCEEKNIEKNPILNWTKNILFWNRATPFAIEREEKFGGNISFASYEELETAFANGDVHPMDLKSAVAQEIIALLAPARAHFAKPEIAAMKQELDDVIAKRG